MSAERVSLTGASWIGGARRADAELRPLTQEEGLELLETLEGEPPVRAATAVLAHCVARLGGLDNVGDEEVRALTLGDREALMLRLRRLSLGNRMECSTWCECGERLEVGVGLESLLLEPYHDPREWHERQLDGPRRRFRLATGGDVEAVTPLALADPEAAARLLLERCCEGDADDAVGEELGRLDPQAEIVLTADCPECGRRVEVELDASGFVLEELRRFAAALLAEVHLIASRYHWSEAEIVAMGPARRRRYIDLIDSEGAWAASY